MEESEDDLHEWRDIMMSPKGLYSDFAPEHCVTKSVVDVFSCGEGSVGGNDEKAVWKSKSDLDRKLENCGPCLNSSIAGVDPDVIKMGGSIAERRAAKFGFKFNAAKISTPRFRSSSLLPSPAARSPYLIVSASISPSALLDSPILLPNSQPSPTTGTLTSPTLDGDIQMLVSTSSVDGGNGIYGGSSSMFESNTDPTRQVCLPAVEKQVSSTGVLPQSLMAHVDSQNLTSVHPSVDFQFPVQFPKEAAVDNYDAGSPPDRKFSDGLSINDNSHSNTVPCIQMPDKNEPSQEEDSGTNNSLDGDHYKGTYATIVTLRTAEDGYNWRKYGQKQVKGSEYPRSYYKCTHPSCQVKKKVERSHDGHITEIIYKGAHNHSKPQPCRKSAFGTPDVGDVSGSCGNSSVWANIRPGCKDVKIGSEWRTDGMETSVVTEVSDPMSTFQGKLMGMLESAGTPEFSSTLASHEDDEEDTSTQGSFPLEDDNDNENDSKRRKKESCFVETTLGSRAVREPRVVIQIESEIDILDDGYRWRKYGQKVVKGNPNPRSYYKCTSAGCTVRKHVERASHNLKFVITTYEGKHNHEVPAARNSTHSNSPAAATNTQSALTLPRNSNLPKPEPHVQDLPPHFGRPNFLGNLGGGPSPFYPMKFPVLPNTRPYGPFGLSNHHTGYPGGLLPVIPDISIPLPPGFPHSSNLAMSSVQPLFAGHQSEESNAKQLLRPKLEQGDESFYDTGMHNVDHTNSSSSSGYNHHTVRTFPS